MQTQITGLWITSSSIRRNYQCQALAFTSIRDIWIYTTAEPRCTAGSHRIRACQRLNLKRQVMLCRSDNRNLARKSSTSTYSISSSWMTKYVSTFCAFYSHHAHVFLFQIPSLSISWKTLNFASFSSSYDLTLGSLWSHTKPRCKSLLSELGDIIFRSCAMISWHVSSAPLTHMLLI